VAQCRLSVGGCGSAPADVARATVDKAVLAAAPELAGVEFVAATPPPFEPGPVPVEIRSSRVPVEIGRRRGPGGRP
jgi:hypothetical protein